MNGSLNQQNGQLGFPQLTFYSDLNVNVTFDGNFKLIKTFLFLCVDSLLNSNIEIDQDSKSSFISSSSTLGYGPQLFLYYDWSDSPSENDLSGNNNNLLEVFGAEWKPDGYYQFESNSDTLNIPNIPGKFGWQSATISLLIWFDSANTNRFGLDSCGCGLQLGNYFAYGCDGSSSFDLPRNQWINVVLTTSGDEARLYINGKLVETIYSEFHCETVSDFFSLGHRSSYSSGQWVAHSTSVFRGRIKKCLFLLELSQKLKSRQKINFLGNSETLSFHNSSVHVDRSVIHCSDSSLNFFNFSIINSELDLPSVEFLTFNKLSLFQNSKITSYHTLSIVDLHWFDGELYLFELTKLCRLFLYGQSKSWPHSPLLIEKGLHFNNSLTFSTFHLSLSNVSASCYPDSELVLDPLHATQSFIEIESQLNLTSNCSLTSLLPVQSTGIIVVGNNSVLTLYKDFSASSMFMILPKGELLLKNGSFTFGGSGFASNTDLFLYYNWITSLNQIDLSGTHDPNEITINGPKWKTDSIGGYLEIQSGQTLHIPNIPGTRGWRDASISLWMFFKKGGMGVSGDNHCRFVIREDRLFWGGTSRVVTFPEESWFHLVITFDQTTAFVYIDGSLEETHSPNNPYHCSSPHGSFPLSEVDGISTSFDGRIRAVQIFTKTLTVAEINELHFNFPGVGGSGKLSLVDCRVVYLCSILGSSYLSLSSSILQLDSFITIELKLLELDSSELIYNGTSAEVLINIDSIRLTNTSAIVTNASLIVSNFHWFNGELFSPGILDLRGLFLYGESKTWPQNSLILENGLFFNNSLTFSIHHLTLNTVSATCFPGSELVLDSPSFSKSSLEVKNQLHFTSNCDLTSLLPVQSTGIIAVGNDSVMTLNHELKSFFLLFISYSGELLLTNTSFTLSNARSYSHDHLFLYYNWAHSFNEFDLSGNHYSTAIIIDGPQWKTDSNGGYLDIKPFDTFRIPNIPGDFGWRNASISLWIYFESGGFGFDFSSACRLYITTNRVRWGPTQRIIAFPSEKWFHLAITFDHLTATVYINGNPESPFSIHSFMCPNGPMSFFPLSEIHPVSSSDTRFKGRIRAVKMFTKALTPSEVEDLHFDLQPSIWGHGKLSFVNSNVEILSSHIYINSLSLDVSALYFKNVIFENLGHLDLYNQSIVGFSQDSEIRSQCLYVTLDSSFLYHNDSVIVSPTILSVTAVNSGFETDCVYLNFDTLDFSFSTLELSCGCQISVGYFYCYDCQILGNSSLMIESSTRIYSGNFSSSLVVQDSTDNSSICGQVQLANSFDFFSHVILDDVSVSQFQSTSGSIACHSDVWMKNVVILSSTSFDSDADVILSDVNVILEQDLELSKFQILRGSGVIFDNTSHSGKIIPLPLIIFDDILSLSPSSTVSIQIYNDSSTQLIIGSTAYLDGILEVEFDPHDHCEGGDFTLIDSAMLIGRFFSVGFSCSSIFKILYSTTSVIGSFNGFIADLAEVAYISTTGIDDPCCGTFDSPCASFVSVLERMGRKGRIYFVSGRYYYNQGLGNVTDVDWEVIGLGDVIIDGIDETSFDILIQFFPYQMLTLFAILLFAFPWSIQHFN
ncbi:hypothetical protein GEMRC1_008313 [Eukaryota sp. GEM-RC1]